LLEKVDCPENEPPLILQLADDEIVNEFVSVGRSRGLLEQQGLSTALAFLVYGPPGCGKSRLARRLANELELPLYVARLDGLISSFLGNTAKNIRTVFEFAASTPCVLFLDEFDAIAKLRDDTCELGELKRVVNSFIQNLDGLGIETVVIAATNHPHLLDNAVWRRFNYRLEIPLPDTNSRFDICYLFLSRFFNNEEITILTDLTEGLSGGDINEVSLHLRRRSIALKAEPTIADAFTSLLNIAVNAKGEEVILLKLRGKNAEECAKILRQRNAALYSLSVIGNLLGVSKATAGRWVKKEGNLNA